MNTYDRNIKAVRCLVCVLALTIVYSIWVAGRAEQLLADTLVPIFTEHAGELADLS